MLRKTVAVLKNMRDAQLLYSEIPDEKKHLIFPINWGVNKKEIEDWKNKYNERKKIDVESEFITKSGIKVRSKSELIIADRFESYEIPYRYESVLNVNNRLWFPDFLVMNPKTTSEYYWEHFGLMDNPEYCDNAISKIEIYAKEGIILGKNLIVSFETSKHPLNTKYIDTIINRFLL